MSKLPRTEDLSRAGEGYDPARVEEAFSAFPETMEVFLDRLAAEYGGARGYLRDRGVTAEELHRLSEALVE